MASKYWLKLYYEILDDPKMGMLPDNVYRRCIELFLLAGQLDDDGNLPDTQELAWMLRQNPESFEAEINHLKSVGIVTQTESGWVVTNFEKRQAPVSDADRMREYRKRKRLKQFENAEKPASVTPPDTPPLHDGDDSVTGSVTNRNRDNRYTESLHTSYEVCNADAEQVLEKPGEFSVKDIKTMMFTRSQYERLLERELERPRPRKTLVAHLKSKLTPKPLAVEVYRSVTQRYPERVFWEEIQATVGDKQEDLDSWRKVVYGYVGMGWNKTSVSRMLEFFRNREIPSPANGQGGNNGSHQKSNGSGRKPAERVTKRVDLKTKRTYWWDNVTRREVPAPA